MTVKSFKPSFIATSMISAIALVQILSSGMLSGNAQMTPIEPMPAPIEEEVPAPEAEGDAEFELSEEGLEILCEAFPLNSRCPNGVPLDAPVGTEVTPPVEEVPIEEEAPPVEPPLETPPVEEDLSPTEIVPPASEPEVAPAEVAPPAEESFPPESTTPPMNTVPPSEEFGTPSEDGAEGLEVAPPEEPVTSPLEDTPVPAIGE